MIGGISSDIEFGKRLNMKTVLIDKTGLRAIDLGANIEMICKNQIDVISVYNFNSDQF